MDLCPQHLAQYALTYWFPAWIVVIYGLALWSRRTR
jgi:hypothetical protein